MQLDVWRWIRCLVFIMKKMKMSDVVTQNKKLKMD